MQHDKTLSKIHKVLDQLLHTSRQYTSEEKVLGAYSLIYATDNVKEYLRRRRFRPPQELPVEFSGLARAYHRDWCLTKWNHIDPTFTRTYIPDPKNQETLGDYLIGLHKDITTNDPKVLTWGRSLHSFLVYLKEILLLLPINTR